MGGYGLNRGRADLCRRRRRLSDGLRCHDREKSLEDQHWQSYREFTDDLHGEWAAVCDDAVRVGGTYFCSAAVVSSVINWQNACPIQMSDSRKVLYSVDEGVARIPLNCPDERNALARAINDVISAAPSGYA